MEQLQIDQIERQYTIMEKYYPLVLENLPKNEKKLFRYIAQYRDNNIEILSSPYPLNYPIFSEEDRLVLFDTCKIKLNDLKETISKVPLPKGVKEIKNFEPFQALCILCMKYYLDKKDSTKITMIYYYMAYSMYWTIFKKYYKKFLPREETMVYTVNNMSNKFILKQVGSVDKFLLYTVEKSIEAYSDRVQRCSDAEISYIISAIKTKLSNYMNKITNEYMQNYNNNEVIFKSSEFLEDGSMRESKSIGSQVDSYANEYTNKFFSEEPNQKIVNMVAKIKGISSSELKTTITLLLDQQRIDEVKAFYSSLFYLYFSENSTKSKNIKSMEFLGVMETIYKKGNSKDKNIVTIKTLMNKWLEEGSKTYRSSNRQPLLNDYRKAIYYYFVFLVSSNT